MITHVAAQSSSITHTRRQGKRRTDTVIVRRSELSGYPAADKLLGAVLTAAAGLGPGLPHPNDASLICDSIRASPLDAAGDCVVLLDYEDAGALVFGVTANLASERTNLDRLGDPIVTTDNSEADPQGHLVDIYSPTETITVERDETNASPRPLTRCLTYLGRVNSTPWPPSRLDTARKWLCTGITCRGWHLTSTRYSMQYEFAFRSQAWDTHLVHIDSDGKRKSVV